MKKSIETLGGTLGDAATFPDILAGAARKKFHEENRENRV
jgi:hypothetical protein